MFKIKFCGYTVIACQEIISQLFENIERLDQYFAGKLSKGKTYFVINWYNFNKGSIYYDNNGEPYTVKEIDHENKIVVL